MAGNSAPTGGGTVPYELVIHCITQLIKIKIAIYTPLKGLGDTHPCWVHFRAQKDYNKSPIRYLQQTRTFRAVAMLFLEYSISQRHFHKSTHKTIQ
jgi:hypothetical protein